MYINNYYTTHKLRNRRLSQIQKPPRAGTLEFRLRKLHSFESFKF